MGLRTCDMALASVKITRIHSLRHNLCEGFVHLREMSFYLPSQVTNGI